MIDDDNKSGRVLGIEQEEVKLAKALFSGRVGPNGTRTFHCHFSSRKVNGAIHSAVDYLARENDFERKKEDFEFLSGDIKQLKKACNEIHKTARVRRGRTAERVLIMTVVELPAEMNEMQRRKTAEELVHFWKERGHVAVAAIHGNGIVQPHIHLAATARPILVLNGCAFVDRDTIPPLRDRMAVRAERKAVAEIVNDVLGREYFHPGKLRDTGINRPAQKREFSTKKGHGGYSPNKKINQQILEHPETHQSIIKDRQEWGVLQRRKRKRRKLEKERQAEVKRQKQKRDACKKYSLVEASELDRVRIQRNNLKKEKEITEMELKKRISSLNKVIEKHKTSKEQLPELKPHDLDLIAEIHAKENQPINLKTWGGRHSAFEFALSRLNSRYSGLLQERNLEIQRLRQEVRKKADRPSDQLPATIKQVRYLLDLLNTRGVELEDAQMPTERGKVGLLIRQLEDLPSDAGDSSQQFTVKEKYQLLQKQKQELALEWENDLIAQEMRHRNLSVLSATISVTSDQKRRDKFIALVKQARALNLDLPGLPRQEKAQKKTLQKRNILDY